MKKLKNLKTKKKKKKKEWEFGGGIAEAFCLSPSFLLMGCTGMRNLQLEC